MVKVNRPLFEAMVFGGLIVVLLFATRGRAQHECHTVNNGVAPKSQCQRSMPKTLKAASTEASATFLKSISLSAAAKNPKPMTIP